MEEIETLGLGFARDGGGREFGRRRGYLGQKVNSFFLLYSFFPPLLVFLGVTDGLEREEGGIERAREMVLSTTTVFVCSISLAPS